MARITGIRSKIKGNSKALLDAIKRIERVAPIKSPVLITGESGTGKEMAARLIHEKSKRTGNLVVFNCANFPKDLMESELFGHTKGAYTDAKKDSSGLFGIAEKGTIFMDEVAEIPLQLQAKLLRAIGEGEIRQVGSNETKKIDVRIIYATNRNLQKMTDDGVFREDLFYRIKGYPVKMPPLRDRARDILILARYFLKMVASNKRIGRDVEALLLGYEWRGNIRELKNVIEHAAIDAGRTIRSEHIQEYINFELEDRKATDMSRHDRIMEVIDLNGSASSEDIQAQTNISKTTLFRELSTMRAAGILVRYADGKKYKYARADAPVSKDSDELNARQQIALRQVEDAGRITRQEYIETTGTSIRTASRDIEDLVKKGILASDGRSGKLAGYVLA